MNRETEMELMRLLHGELPPDRERALRARLEREPELAAAWARLQRTWNGLELPPPAPIPLGFAQRVAARTREQSGARLPLPGEREMGSISWQAAPGWVRAAAAAALVAGAALGAGAGVWTGGRTSPVPEQGEQISGTAAEDGSLFGDDLAESYWSALDELGETPAAGDPAGDAL